MKISILLPYKENFAPNYAGAVSLFVNDITEESFFKNSTFIFGNTNSKIKLSKNYINLNLKKKVFQSTSKLYINSFLKFNKKINADLVEVHNRPNYINLIKKSFKNKLILYFHNDPLTMNGSRSIKERIDLLNNVDKIIFNSRWSQKRFFIGLPNDDELLSQKTSVCYQSSSKVKIDFKKKEKTISFVGKLNRAKGYDIFGEAIIKILNKHNDWTAKVIGDEPREKLIYNHKRLKLLGFKNNNYILNELKKISVSVICSRWDEPFGRTSLEAASRGSAVIISDKGGLPETTKDAIILNPLSSSNLFKTIDNLIQDKKKLLTLQKNNYLHFMFTHKYISNIIDLIRKSFVKKSKIFLPSIKLKKIFKILHITNFNQRFNGRLHYNTGRRINNGFIRLGHNVLTISDRDIINKNKRFVDYSGKKTLQNSILDAYENFHPDCIVLGHADSVSNNTLDTLRNLNKDLKISQWFLDPLGVNGPDYHKNAKRIKEKIKYIDKTFLTTDPNSLDFNLNNSHFIPNPCDESFETLKNYENDCNNDVFFAMSHGVHRGGLKKGKYDDREFFINKLIKQNKKINFDIYGMNNVQPIWGNDFIDKVSSSSMGLNLSRGKPVKYYSSDRVAQLMGNGLLTFVDEKTCFADFISNDKIIYYKNIIDLSYKLNKYKKDHKKRKLIAKKGKEFYLKNLNSTIIADFILSNTMDYKSKNNFVWV
ncbi:glycosyltransferase family 4 protein [Candidatus Pelagibacter sp.]|jgi:glycosyltransferase involved in cell wall biosynthesis|nr:glycosyltransferase family 4 protein [Candidatus Pelagibacter sp.]